ncbi:Cyanovirin-N [Mycena vulgaris]|nr:Cyanovirin-N [Mycena vulgaris]KAJ6533378.1 Cyanovirin-N [Mycena vulgaris]
MSFSHSSRFYRLEGTHLHAQCHDAHGNTHDSTLDLNHVLGNHEGQFDRNGRDFSGSAALFGLNGTTLVARLRHSDGSHQDASIDLNSVVCNRDGRLEKA